MNVFKKMLLVVRWGDELTEGDWDLARSMTFWEVLKSSYLNPKTIEVKYNNSIKRR